MPVAPKVDPFERKVGGNQRVIKGAFRPSQAEHCAVVAYPRGNFTISFCIGLSANLCDQQLFGNHNEIQYKRFLPYITDKFASLTGGHILILPRNGPEMDFDYPP